MSKHFTRVVENFVCNQCGERVNGTGYTNHCPHCLWSKHVDIYPGDRSEVCCGMMRPTGIKKKGSEYILTHTCERCGAVKNNKLNTNDNMEEVITLAKMVAEK